MKVKIRARPEGSAPEHIRDAWVGLVFDVLPKYQGRLHYHHGGFELAPHGMLRRLYATFFGPRVDFKGYAVDAFEAVSALEANSPEAAAWWRTNEPRVFAPGEGAFVFPACDCEELK
jgi:hypothetical protein